MSTTWIVIAMLLAQWVNVPLPKSPRLPDGKPDLAAPVPKTRDGKPDLSGIWRVVDTKYLQNIATDGVQVPFQPWAEEVFKERQANFGKDNPSGRCLPHGVPDSFLVRATPFKIVQTPFVTVALLENQGHYRQIFTDGRGFPEDTPSTWMGYSIGKWEGEWFVVDSIGFNDHTFIDAAGRSPSGRTPDLEEKMEEYVLNGAHQAWLLDPSENRAAIYRPGLPPERIENPTILSGDPVLPGFRFDFREIL